jgi:folate-dependent tRNA-U54 methylase TrmFO/GidA
VARFLAAKVEGLYSTDAHDLDVSVNRDGENLLPPRTTAMGSLHAAITDETKIAHFQPTNINFGHMPDPHAFSVDAGVLGHARIDKRAKRLEQIRIAKASFNSWVGETATFKIAHAGSLVERAARQLAQYTVEQTADV